MVASPLREEKWEKEVQVFGLGIGLRLIVRYVKMRAMSGCEIDDDLVTTLQFVTSRDSLVYLRWIAYRMANEQKHDRVTELQSFLKIVGVEQNDSWHDVVRLFLGNISRSWFTDYLLPIAVSENGEGSHSV
jgi:hypothetical protein